MNGCSETGRAVLQDPGLSRFALQTVGDGFVLHQGPASGPADIEMAAAAGQADTEAARHQLERSSFSGGYVRVWTRHRQSVIDAVYRFDHAVDSARYLAFEISSLSNQPSAYVTDVPDIPGGRQFVLNGVLKTGSATSFCRGVWFSIQQWAFNIYVCDRDAPVGSSIAEDLARLQYGLDRPLIFGTPEPQSDAPPPTAVPNSP